MAVTNDPQLADALRLLRSHGITRDASRFQSSGAGPWHYEQQALGYNYRLTDIHAALGFSQLGRLEANVARRNALAARYHAALSGLPLRLPAIAAGNRSAFHLYVVRIDPARGVKSHREAFDDLRRRGIGVNLHYLPVHLQPYYRALGFSEGSWPQAEAHGREAITLPLYAALGESQQDAVVEALRAVLA
jgi:dTDP-4-amino-4,6-dideoxygalactose transaminase